MGAEMAIPSGMTWIMIAVARPSPTSRPLANQDQIRSELKKTMWTDAKEGFSIILKAREVESDALWQVVYTHSNCCGQSRL